MSRMIPDGTASLPDLSHLRAWIVTDGKAGDENPCLGLAERLRLHAEVRRIPPERLFHWAAPWGPVDPRDAPGRAGGILAGPLPDLLIASGRRAVPYLRAVRRASRGRTFTAFLKDPRTGPETADFTWVPDYDGLRGPTVLATPTGPHRVSPERIAAERADPDPRLAALPEPRVAVLVGGDSRRVRYGPDEIARFAADLGRLQAEGAALMITLSRRTPPALRNALDALVRDRGGFLWDGGGANPYAAMLALADAVVVTSDSTNMVGEAACTGVPLLLFMLPDTHMRHRRLCEGLAARGALHPFTGRLETGRYPPIDATPAIAAALAAAVDQTATRGL